MALLTDLLRASLTEPSESALQTKLLEEVASGLQQDEIAVFDAGFKVKTLQEVRISRFVVRLSKNFTARRNVLPTPLRYGTPTRMW